MNDYATLLALWFGAIVGEREMLELELRVTADDLTVIISTPVKTLGRRYDRATIMQYRGDIQEFALSEFHRQVRNLRSNIA